MLTSLVSFFTRLRPTQQFRWQLLVVLPVPVPVGTYLLLGPSYLSSWPVFLGATILNTGLVILCQWLLDQLTQRVRVRYPGLHQSGKRLGLLGMVFLLISLVFLVLVLSCYTHFRWFGYSPQPEFLPRILGVNAVANLTSVGVFESLYSLTKWRENMQEKEELKRVNLQSQYASLKDQVSPHFLFNTLNTLASLIDEAPQQAETFVDELAKVYRYLLQTNRNTTDEEGELTTLSAELVFIQSYFHLLKTRYGAGVEMDIAVTQAHQARLLPPLTLQLLVENAVKHNVVQASRPLRIEIKSVPDGHLMVRNNLQPKASHPERQLPSRNQVGLSNIQAKYRLLAQRRHPDIPTAIGNIAIDKSATHFTLLLPLLSQLS